MQCSFVPASKFGTKKSLTYILIVPWWLHPFQGSLHIYRSASPSSFRPRHSFPNQLSYFRYKTQPLLITSTMRSSITFVIAACLAAAVQAQHSGHGDSRHPRYENCSPVNGSCTGCGTDFVQCGSNACYNPTANETCCSNTCEYTSPFPLCFLDF